MFRVPDEDVLSLLDTYFPPDTIPPGAYVRQDKNDTVYLYGHDDSFLAMMPLDTMFHLREEDEKEEGKTHETTNAV